MLYHGPDQVDVPVVLYAVLVHIHHVGLEIIYVVDIKPAVRCTRP